MTFEDFCKELNEKGVYQVSEDYDEDEHVKFFQEEFYCFYKNTHPIEMKHCTHDKSTLSKPRLIRKAATQFLVKKGLDS